MPSSIPRTAWVDGIQMGRDERPGSLPAGRMLTVASKLGPASCLLAVITAVLPVRSIWWHHAHARGMRALRFGSSHHVPPLQDSTPAARPPQRHPGLGHLIGATLLASTTALYGAQNPHPQPAGLEETLQRVSERVEQWYRRAQTVVSRETVTIQPLGPGLTPSDVPRRLVYDLRVGWEPGSNDAGAPAGSATILREMLGVSGRTPRSGEDPGCMDPKPVSPEPLAMLLPARLGESIFSDAGSGRVDGRRANMIDYRGSVALPPEISWTDRCVTVSLPGRSRGRIWIDAQTHQVLRIDDRLVGTFEIEVPREQVRRGAARSMVIERAESSIRYRAIPFQDPEETLMLPVSIETVTVIRGYGVQRVRITQRLSDHRRFLTGGRLLD